MIPKTPMMSKTLQLKKPATIDDLRPAPYNPRKIGRKAADGLGLSLERFGDVSGIVWNARTGHLVAGHQRVMELKNRGGKLDDDAVVLPSGERFVVRVVDWTEAQERAANVSANNPHISGEWTDDLRGLLGEIEGEMPAEDFAGLGLDELLGALPSDGADELTELSQNPDVEYRVVVLTRDADEQAKLMERLEGEGYKCQLLMS